MGPIRFPLAALTLFCAAQAEAKTLVYCFESDPATLSAVLAVSGADLVASAHQMFDSLTAMNSAMTEIEPALAEAWEVADDGRTYTFHLRRGVKFHENHGFTPTRELNADDVLFTFERQWKPDHPFHQVSGGNYTFFDVYGLNRLLERIEKLDDHTVRFRLIEPDAVFPLYMSAPPAAIYSAEYAQRLEAAGTLEKLDREPIGTGPFKLVEHRKDALIRYAAHPDYWGGKPALDQT
jgi:dipeptide transport system substrate-binding protein